MEVFMFNKKLLVIGALLISGATLTEGITYAAGTAPAAGAVPQALAPQFNPQQRTWGNEIIKLSTKLAEYKKSFLISNLNNPDYKASSFYKVSVLGGIDRILFGANKLLELDSFLSNNYGKFMMETGNDVASKYATQKDGTPLETRDAILKSIGDGIYMIRQITNNIDRNINKCPNISITEMRNFSADVEELKKKIDENPGNVLPNIKSTIWLNP